MNPNLPPHYPPGMPPVPRDLEKASHSELIPFSSSKIRLWRSPVALLALMAALIAPLLFLLGDAATLEGSTLQERFNYFKIIAFFAILFFVVLFQVAIYLYAQPGRSIFFYFWPFLFVAVTLWIPFLTAPWFFLFREILPTDPSDLTASSGFFRTFFVMLFGAGLMEELMKATPILIGAIITLRMNRLPASQPPSALARFFAVRGPLDGVLMGIFAGGGFILIETAVQYVPNAVAGVFNQTENLNEGFGAGLLLLLPRTIDGITGHMGYAAVFGYFIGLGVLRRKQFVPLVLAGWLLTSAIHAMWNSVNSHTLFYILSLLTALLAAGALLKARQLHKSMHGAPADTQGSIVIDRSGGGRPARSGYVPPAGPLADYVPGAMPAMPGAGHAPAAPPLWGHAPVPPTLIMPPAPAPIGWQQQPAAPAASGGARPLHLDFGGHAIGLTPGTWIDLGGDPALGGLGAGILVAVIAHSSDPGMLGIYNGSNRAWPAHHADGRSQPIGQGQTVTVLPGMRIDFGNGIFASVKQG